MNATLSRPRRLVLTVLALVIAVAVPTSGQATERARAALAVTKVSAPPKLAEPGDRIAVTATVANRTGRSTPKTALHLFLSKDKTWSGSDRALGGNPTVKPIKKGKQVSTKAPGTIAVGTPDGKYYVIVCVGKPSAKTCHASVGQVTIRSRGTGGPGGVFRGTLTGRLTLRDAGEDLAPDTGLSWDRSANVDVRLDVSGAPGYVVSSPCRRDWTVDESGLGDYVWTGDPFTDEIGGHFTRTDRSRVRVWLFSNYDRTTTTTRSGPAAEGCTNSNEEVTTEALDVVSIELERHALTEVALSRCCGR